MKVVRRNFQQAAEKRAVQVHVPASQFAARMVAFSSTAAVFEVVIYELITGLSTHLYE